MNQLSLRRFLSFTLVFSLLLAHAGFAASLTNRQIESFLNSMEALDAQMPDFNSEVEEEPSFEDENFDLDAYYAQLEEEMNAMMNEFDLTKMATYSVEQVQATEHFSLFKRVISEHGFRNPDDWAELGDRVLAAYFAQQMGDTLSGEALSEEERAMMQTFLGDMMSGLEDVPQEDIRAITPYLDRLDVLMNSESDDEFYDDY